MLLDFLLPGRQAKRERCLKSVSYIEFISNSIMGKTLIMQNTRTL